MAASKKTDHRVADRSLTTVNTSAQFFSLSETINPVDGVFPHMALEVFLRYQEQYERNDVDSIHWSNNQD